MACSNERSPHPVELFGDDWLTWGNQPSEPPDTNSRAPLQTSKHSTHQLP